MTTPETLRQLQAEITPGPWEVYLDEEEVSVRAGDALPDENGYLPGSHRFTNLIAEHELFSEDPDDPEPDDVLRIANAHLIAAAPTHLADLITALEREAKVREVHGARVNSEVHRSGRGLSFMVCNECGLTYPCPTIRILDGNE